MSYGIYITSSPDRLPETSRWNAAIRAAGFDLELDSVDWANQTGFLPVRLLGVRTGFELANEQPRIAAYLHSSGFELAAATVALAVLQSITGGQYSDDDEQSLSAEVHVAQARDLYNQGRVLLRHLESSKPLAWNEPPLDPTESKEQRMAALGVLLSRRDLVKEVGADGERYRLHRLRGEKLRQELQIQPDS